MGKATQNGCKEGTGGQLADLLLAWMAALASFVAPGWNCSQDGSLAPGWNFVLSFVFGWVVL